MENQLYVMFVERGKTYNKMTKAMAERHVAHIKNQDDNGRLALCGLLKGLPGVAGMLVLKAQSYEEAEEICKAEPLVVEGLATYKLVTLQVADRLTAPP